MGGRCPLPNPPPLRGGGRGGGDCRRFAEGTLSRESGGGPGRGQRVPKRSIHQRRAAQARQGGRVALLRAFPRGGLFGGVQHGFGLLLHRGGAGTVHGVGAFLPDIAGGLFGEVEGFDHLFHRFLQRGHIDLLAGHFVFSRRCGW
ncbi:hypothetical protein DS843_03930 [Roseomonas genomospecies 6]|uniref:Uncharacterized protein n=1 Tax=Roseomonas genomospecies 6 TaxID=214106 RepID=A0A9W7NNE5_9PROT|nr:hypothetical protein DS843_03930 [Roseomonas genomospecies 6]